MSRGTKPDDVENWMDAAEKVIFAVILAVILLAGVAGWFLRGWLGC